MDNGQERKTEDRPERSLGVEGGGGPQGGQKRRIRAERFLEKGEKCINMPAWFHQVIQVAVAMSWKLLKVSRS